MRSLEFVQIDVFTDRPFAGNQLAVFLDGSGLSTSQMQTIAREMNFSESTFILPRSSPESDAQLRIFTTTKEMPMAGHPVVGTALVLFEQKKLRVGRNIFDLAMGRFEVSIEEDDKTGPVIWMNQGTARFGDTWPDRQGLARVLGLESGDLSENLPIQVVSTGVPFLIVPVRSLTSLEKARCEQGALRSYLGSHEGLYLYPFAPGPNGFRARMFDPTPNEIPEDPATGSAAGPLAAYASHYRLSSGTEMMIEQGVEMGRPSLILARTERVGDAENVLIGGTGKIVGEGRIFLD
jgi:trans-2,3-dihydro-3-hydroxyanthranilate isomerase